MGRFHEAGWKIISGSTFTNQEGEEVEVEIERKPRDVIVGGTAIGEQIVLDLMGMEVTHRFKLKDVGIHLHGQEQPGEIILGTMAGRDVVMTLGRVHLFEDQENLARGVHDLVVRRFFSVIIALMGSGTRVVLASSVGGISDDVKQGMVVQAEDLIASGLPQLHLRPSEVEFQVPGYHLWRKHKASGANRAALRRTFIAAAKHAGFKYRIKDGAVAQGIVGPSFGSKAERRIWKMQGTQVVTMSQIADTTFFGIESMDRLNAGEKPLQILSICYVTDATDFARHTEIKADGEARAPQFALMLRYAIEHPWD